MGLGLFLSSWTPFDELARQSAYYRALLVETPPSLRANPARGHVDVARWVYVAETDAKAKSDSEAGIMRNLAHFASGHASGYLGTVVGATMRDYDTLTRDIILHGSPATVIGKIEELQANGAQRFAHAALPALVRRGQGAGLARTICRRSDAEIPAGAACAEERVKERAAASRISETTG